jgi:hypothetical protein
MHIIYTYSYVKIYTYSYNNDLLKTYFYSGLKQSSSVWDRILEKYDYEDAINHIKNNLIMDSRNNEPRFENRFPLLGIQRSVRAVGNLAGESKKVRVYIYVYMCKHVYIYINTNINTEYFLIKIQNFNYYFFQSI